MELVVVVWVELDRVFNDRLPILGVLHMEKVPGNGVDCGSDDGEENRNPDPMIDGSPTILVCGMEGLTEDINVALISEECEAPIVDEVDTPSVLEGVPNIDETMALIVDTVGVAPTKRFRFLVLGGGVTPTVDGVIVPMVSGLMLSTIKETMEAAVEEAYLSISSGGVACPNVGLSGSK